MTVKRFRKMLNKHNSLIPLMVVVRSKSMRYRLLIELNKHPGKSALMASNLKELAFRQAVYFQEYLEANPLDDFDYEPIFFY